MILPFYNYITAFANVWYFPFLYIELLDSGPKHVGNAIKWLGYPNLNVDSCFSLVIHSFGHLEELGIGGRILKWFIKK
jgi:hypothetical protein